MRFPSMFLMAVVACAMSAQATSPVEAQVGSFALRKRVDQPGTHSFGVRDSSLMEGSARMRRHVKRCKSSSKVASKSKSKTAKSKHPKSTNNDSSDDDDDKDEDDEDKDEDDEDKSSGSDILGKAKGLIGLSFDGQCKSPGASSKYPNGNIDFLNCGLSKKNPSGKWTPPDVKMSQLKFVSSSAAAKSSAFKPCAKYQSAFDSAASSTGVPAVLLMAFAMQESTCNPSVRGGNGEIGMMQLTPDKCKGANCWDATTNIKMAAKYFKGQLDSSKGNALLAIGSYNGWQEGLTFSRATSQQYGCHAQNNLDYLNQMLNGWAQGKDGHSMTVYNNLAQCGGD